MWLNLSPAPGSCTATCGETHPQASIMLYSECISDCGLRVERILRELVWLLVVNHRAHNIVAIYSTFMLECV